MAYLRVTHPMGAEQLKVMVYDVGGPLCTTDMSIEDAREFLTQLTSVIADYETQMKRRHALTKIAEHVRRGDRINAIKEIRALPMLNNNPALGLRDAKDILEAVLDGAR